MNNLKILRTFVNLTQEELAQKLSFNKDTITQYELGNSIPTFKSLKKFIDFYQTSFDYLILNENCSFPRNLKFLNLAIQLDSFSNPQIRSHIEITVKSFLDKIKTDETEIKLDSLDIELTDNFHKNLKLIRKSRKIQQNKMAKDLEITPALLGMYENRNYPPITKIIDMAKMLNSSIHVIATGKKLFFDFQDRHFGKTMLLADRFLTPEEQKVIILLMETMSKPST